MIRVTASILVNDGMLLIAKRRATARLPNLWDLPGGKVEPDETAERAAQAVRKDVKVGSRPLGPA